MLHKGLKETLRLKRFVSLGDLAIAAGFFFVIANSVFLELVSFSAGFFFSVIKIRLLIFMFYSNLLFTNLLKPSLHFGNALKLLRILAKKGKFRKSSNEAHNFSSSLNKNTVVHS